MQCMNQKKKKEISPTTIRKITIIFIIILIIFFFLFGANNKERKINSFDDCIKTGHPAMESYPRQCRANEITFTEESCQSNGNILTLGDAKQIAINSECGDRLTENHFCNKDTETYWIDLNIKKKGCNPACVINVRTKEASINYRCMDLIEP